MLLLLAIAYCEGRSESVGHAARGALTSGLQATVGDAYQSKRHKDDGKLERVLKFEPVEAAEDNTAEKAADESYFSGAKMRKLLQPPKDFGVGKKFVGLGDGSGRKLKRILKKAATVDKIKKEVSQI
jgi:hypothetical protein